MKKVIILLLGCCLCLLGYSFGNEVTKEDCVTGEYSEYYPNECKNGGKNCTCGYSTSRLYLGSTKDKSFLDAFINKAGKEIIFSSNSTASIEDFGGYLNEENLCKDESCKTLSYLYSNWVPADIEDNKAAIFAISGVKLLKVPDDYNKPVGLIEYYIRGFYVDDENGNICVVSFEDSTIDTSDCSEVIKLGEHFGYYTWSFQNGEFILNNFEFTEDKKKKININVVFNHYEYYLLFASWCGDGVVDSDHREQCDNGTDNWDGNGSPTVKNGVVCNSSCEIVEPACGSAAKTYNSSSTSFDGDFCVFPSSMDGTTPSFPAPGQSVSWTCKLGNKTVNCSANSEGISNEGSNGGGGSNGGNGSEGDNGGGGSDGGGNNSESCEVSGTCDTGNCGPLSGSVINATDVTTLNKLKEPSSYHNDFCSAGSILSYSYNPQVANGKVLKWYCGTQECSARIVFDRGVIKIYGSYSGAVWPCPECDMFAGFDTENGIPFNSDYDTEYTRSIMAGDYLPFGWILNNYDEYTGTCNSSTVGKYNKNTVKVNFKLFNHNGDLVYITQEYNGFVGSTLTAFPDTSVNGQGYIPSSITPNLSMGENTIKGYITFRQICKAFTDANGNTSYGWADDTRFSIEFSSQTFTVTDHYMLQLGSVLSSVSNVDLRFNGETLSGWGIETVNLPYSNYDTGALSKILGDFINKYKTYSMGTYYLTGDTTTAFKKVLGQEVYYVDLSEQGGSWTIPSDFNPTIPTTILVENGDVTIAGEISGPVMLVVKNGKMKINNSKMNVQSVLEGYYITDKGFEVDLSSLPNGRILNTDPQSNRWYSDSRLLVKGVLIGQNADKIYRKRRSVLKNWFRQGYGPAWAIKHGGSLTITSNPSLWLNPPVGSKDLFEMLKLKKGY